MSASPTYTKEQLIELIASHHNPEVRRAAAATLYSLGAHDGVAEMRGAFLSTAANDAAKPVQS